MTLPRSFLRAYRLWRVRERLAPNRAEERRLARLQGLAEAWGVLPVLWDLPDERGG